MNDFTVSVVGEDRPGIVAAVTGALLELGGNVENCRASILAGSFAMVLAVGMPDGAGAPDIETALAPTLDALGLSAGVRPCTGSHFTATGEQGVITVYGGDRPGIVHGASNATAAEPEDDPLPVEDWATTVYDRLGIDARKELIAPGARPIEIVDGGKVVEQLIT